MESATPTNWWAAGPLRDLVSIIAHINAANIRADHIEFCRDAFSAVNLLWTQLFRYQKRHHQLRPDHLEKGRGDTASFEELLRVTLPDEAKRHLLQSDWIKDLVELNPRVMSHDILRREDYDPSAIPDDLRTKASEKHTELVDAYARWRSGQPPESAGKAVKKLADLLFRSNIAHGEKTPRGPDLEKVRRDQEVCRFSRPVMVAVIRAIFDQPDRRLAVYGTLRPGEPNHQKLSKFQGRWRDARVHGFVIQRNGLPHFIWDISAPEIPVKIIEAAELETNWPDLDRFEGHSYRRIWVVASIDGDGLIVTNIYADKSEISSPDVSE